MRLKWILLFFLFNFSLAQYYKIENDVTKILTGRRGYIYTGDFSGYYRLHMEVTVRNGYFSYSNPYVEMAGNYYAPILDYYTLTDYYYSEDEEYGTYYGPNYSYYTLHFYTPSGSNWDYVYIHFPSYSGDYIEVTITTSGIPVSVVWVLVVLFIAIIVGVIFFVRYRKRQAVVNNPPPVVTQPVPQPYGYNPPIATYAQPGQPTYPPQTLY